MSASTSAAPGLADNATAAVIRGRDATPGLFVSSERSGSLGGGFDSGDESDPISIRSGVSGAGHNGISLAGGERILGRANRIVRFPAISKGGNSPLAPVGLDALLGSDDNPFITAIKDNFGNRPTVPTPDLKPQKEASAVVKSPPPTAPPPSNQEVGRTEVSQVEGGSTKYSNAYIYVGDMGNHRLQISAALKTGSQSFSLTVDGILGTVRFEPGLNLGPLQSFAVSRGGAQTGVVVTDGILNSIYLYTAASGEQFVAGDGFYVPIIGAVIVGATLSDVNNDGLADLVAGVWFPESGQSFVYLFLQKDGTFVYSRRFLTDLSIGGIHVDRSGGNTTILAVDQSLGQAELVTLDSNGSEQTRVSNVLPVRKQDTKITLSDGKPLWIRLAEFVNVTFLGSYSASGEFGLIGAVENSGQLPSMAIGDLQQSGQRRCWLHF